MSRSRPIALFLPTLKGGGAERMIIQLGAALAERGHNVDLVVGRAKGSYFEQIPGCLRLILLQSPSQFIQTQIPDDVIWEELPSAATHGILPVLLKLKKHLPHLLPLLFSSYGRRILRMIPLLAEYIRIKQPTVLLSALLRANVVAVAGNELSTVSTRIIVSERNHLSTVIARTDNLLVKRGKLARHFYPLADGLVAVSQGVADDLAKLIGIPSERIVAIKNPVVTQELLLKAKQPVTHPWLNDKTIPVVLAAGRLASAKDYPTMLKAIEIIHRERPVRLLVLGEGHLRSSLLAMTNDLHLLDYVDFHGFVENPYAFMSHASVFALSSAWEGSPNVIVEAMACGCPIVSTNCPSGPDEILEGGVYGKLVNVGDSEAMARAIIKQLDTPTDGSLLRRRASQYSAKASADHYEQVLQATNE